MGRQKEWGEEEKFGRRNTGKDVRDGEREVVGGGGGGKDRARGRERGKCEN